jgi:hypothetical protein
LFIYQAKSSQLPIEQVPMKIRPNFQAKHQSDQGST